MEETPSIEASELFPNATGLPDVKETPALFPKYQLLVGPCAFADSVARIVTRKTSAEPMECPLKFNIKRTFLNGERKCFKLASRCMVKAIEDLYKLHRSR